MIELEMIDDDVAFARLTTLGDRCPSQHGSWFHFDRCGWRQEEKRSHSDKQFFPEPMSLSVVIRLAIAGVCMEDDRRSLI
jgi:hypothetical protein